PKASVHDAGDGGDPEPGTSHILALTGCRLVDLRARSVFISNSNVHSERNLYYIRFAENLETFVAGERGFSRPLALAWRDRAVRRASRNLLTRLTRLPSDTRAKHILEPHLGWVLHVGQILRGRATQGDQRWADDAYGVERPSALQACSASSTVWS